VSEHADQIVSKLTTWCAHAKDSWSYPLERTDAEALLTAIRPPARPDTAGLVETHINRLWMELLEKDDRTSPEEYPEMVLITYDEFALAIRSASALEHGAMDKGEGR
jgi:hypothetical protein